MRTHARAVVIGGGVVGVSTLYHLAKKGWSDVLLVERFSYIGGLATGGLIILLLTLDDGAGKQAVAGLCQEIVDRMDALFAIDREAREAGMSFEERHALRQERSAPLVESLHTRLKELRPTVLPKSSMGEAITYTLRGNAFITTSEGAPSWTSWRGCPPPRWT